MHSTWLPKGVCNSLEKLIKRFMWGSDGDARKISLVDWETTKAPVENEGLGIKNMNRQNMAFIMKIGMQLLGGENKLWISSVESKISVDRICSTVYLSAKFSVRSAYQSLTPSLADESTECWRRLWKLNIPQRVKTFRWLSLHGKLMTNLERCRRHIANSRDVRCATSRMKTCSMSFDDAHLLCNVIFQRNYCKHRDLVEQSIRVKNELVAREEMDSDRRSNVRTATRWCKPARNWVKVNDDGAVWGPMKMASAGGVIRDDQGRWIVGFAQNLAVKTLKNNSRLTENGAAAIFIHRLLRRDWEVKVDHVHREANSVAYRLAELARGKEIGSVSFRYPPREIEELVEDEAAPVL
ncbi:hypothetical protein F3Y22_tig00110221pilonHSYRG00209 [Hibiscus syriacus]|uniref:Reverse transcriptase zinc-binding domain-containing protein n=1 Tax=Hibiscus syriacus TaxID=106335 RepID=A0A6A3B801_HIBSY|nr:hypothetical protein F3Y22_tig00110221pilonHSYRG00209 [Hibiscus syriacus]